MKHLSIVLPQGQANLMKIIGTRELFEVANYQLTIAGLEPLFEIQFVGTQDVHKFVSGYLAIRPEACFKEIKKTHLIIIPAMDDSFPKVIAENSELIKWITDQYKNGAQVASLCTGAFLLAATGLLDNKQCTTHWWTVNLFSKMFPKVKVVADKIITDEKGLFTSAGSFSSFNLLLYLIEKLYGRENAINCSKALELDISRSSQSPFMIFSGQKDHDDDEIRSAQEYIEQMVGEKISIEWLAEKAATSKRNFERRFKKATGNTPVEYIQRIRVEAAKKQLEVSRKTVNEIMYDVGYSDVKAFRTIFKKLAGLSPVEYKQHYNRELGQ
jgi:transcriptional regulator GlxA family with amidase domain